MVCYPVSVMDQARPLELTSGPDRSYRRVLWSIWLAAALSLLYVTDQYTWPVLLAGWLLLIGLRPMAHPALTSGRLRLHADGSAWHDGQAGRWRVPAWSTPWGSVVLFESNGCRRRILVCAACNRVDDYRRLRVWTRFPLRSAQPAGLGTPG